MNNLFQVGISFKAFEKSDAEILTKLMLNLSAEDFSGWEATPESIQKTQDHLSQHPDKGNILVFKRRKSLQVMPFSLISGAMNTRGMCLLSMNCISFLNIGLKA
ncbi:MAG: hypothetical protein IPI60_18540 [Saprospiraceae bacterium]|nr:hypothetical protein [Saprospiraceae bacterium]